MTRPLPHSEVALPPNDPERLLAIRQFYGLVGTTVSCLGARSKRVIHLEGEVDDLAEARDSLESAGWKMGGFDDAKSKAPVAKLNDWLRGK